MKQTELELDLAEFIRMDKRIALGKTNLYYAKSIDEIFV